MVLVRQAFDDQRAARLAFGQPRFFNFAQHAGQHIGVVAFAVLCVEAYAQAVIVALVGLQGSLHHPLP